MCELLLRELAVGLDLAQLVLLDGEGKLGKGRLEDGPGYLLVLPFEGDPKDAGLGIVSDAVDFLELPLGVPKGRDVFGVPDGPGFLLSIPVFVEENRQEVVFRDGSLHEPPALEEGFQAVGVVSSEVNPQAAGQLGPYTPEGGQRHGGGARLLLFRRGDHGLGPVNGGGKEGVGHGGSGAQDRHEDDQEPSAAQDGQQVEKTDLVLRRGNPERRVEGIARGGRARWLPDRGPDSGIG